MLPVIYDQAQKYALANLAESALAATAEIEDESNTDGEVGDFWRRRVSFLDSILHIPQINHVPNGRFRNLLGLRFKKMVVIGYGHHPNRAIKNGRKQLIRHWVYRCDCGKIRSAIAGNITSSKQKSCGECYDRRTNVKHGISKEPIYARYMSLRYSYGASGEWATPQQFSENLPHIPEGHTIVINDPREALSPLNFRVVPKDSLRKLAMELSPKMIARHMSLDGRRMSIPRWAEEIGLSHQAVRSRLNNGWCKRCALTNRRGDVCTHIKRKES